MGTTVVASRHQWSVTWLAGCGMSWDWDWLRMFEAELLQLRFFGFVFLGVFFPQCWMYLFTFNQVPFQVGFCQTQRAQTCFPTGSHSQTSHGSRRHEGCRCLAPQSAHQYANVGWASTGSMSPFLHLLYIHAHIHAHVCAYINAYTCMHACMPTSF